MNDDNEYCEGHNPDLLGPTGIVKAWHASSENIKSFHSFSHFGTKEAALQRAKDLGLSRAHLYEVELTIRKSVRINDSGTGNHTHSGIMEYLETALHLNFDDVSEASRSPEAASALLGRYGYDTLVYENGREDKGSTSWVIMAPENVNILEVTIITKASPKPY